jgi:hypothetical protein
MITKKHLLVAVLITFCLTFVLFSVTPTRSANNPYDPWLDTNDDGTINMRDIGAVVSAFGGTGDPAKNVTITGLANRLAYSIEHQYIDGGSSWSSPHISVDGYSKMTVSIYADGGSNTYRLFAGHRLSSFDFQVDEISDFGGYLVRTYDVPNQDILIKLTKAYGPEYVWIEVYLIP